MAHLTRISFSIAFTFLSLIAISQSYPNIAGTWHVNGDKNQPCTIYQENQNLSFSCPVGNSQGYFSSATQVYSEDWNAIATLSADGNTLTWSNQYWTRGTTASAYPDISGTWYIGGDPSAQAVITQSGNQLNFAIAAGSSPGYFHSANQVYASVIVIRN